MLEPWRDQVKKQDPNTGTFNAKRGTYEYAIMKAEDMDIRGALFGFRFVSGGSPNGIVELYIEDDENYFLKATFNMLWVKELATLSKELHSALAPHIAKANKDR
jgi:hypothetical protein